MIPKARTIACFAALAVALAAAALAVTLARALFPPPAAAAAAGAQKRWVYVSSNLYDDENIPKIETVLRSASAAGFNGVLFSDTKTLVWRLLDKPDRWKANAAKVRALATSFHMELVVCVFSFGYAEPFLANDANLAAGLPVKDAPLVRRGDRLIPEETAFLANGSFEDHKGDRVAGFDLQDDPGASSFVDATVCKEGRVSLRFENVGAVNHDGNGRLFQRLAVEHWRQYRIRAWMKTERLTAGNVQITVLGDGNTLQYQSLVTSGPQGLTHFSAASDLTTDWVEQSVTFNSLGFSSVIVEVGIWGAKSGTIWWDDIRVDDVPALNVLRRESLPLSVTGESGVLYEEGKDFGRIVDPQLGHYLWAGRYDTRHEQPVITVPPGSRIGEGERVKLSCYNPPIFYGGQVSCTLNDPKIFELCAGQIRSVVETLSPDGFFIACDEIRCAGWEPSQERDFHGSGALLAFNIKRCYEIASREGGGKPVYVWSDMFDPYHNARKDYYLVNGSLEKSWEGLDPNVVVMKWWASDKAAQSLSFFSERGNRLMIAAFYDGDVDKDHALWMNAASGTPGIDGVMYTTWSNDYSKLEEFARAWWGGGR
ncbi:MAG: hypothetical protein ABR899_01650 [Candidatus Krumholzibacteriaceae bacterium]|jgi:hypothetical protein